MADVRALIAGLKEYLSSLKRYRKKNERGFKELKNQWHSLRNCYNGEGAELLHKHWKQTEKEFNEYFERSLHLLVFLDERIESLSFYERQESLVNLTSNLAKLAASSTGSKSKIYQNSALIALNAFLGGLGGDHSSQYKRVRKKFLKNQINNPELSASNRNIIKNRLLKKPNPSYMRGIPGYDAGHRIADIDTPDNLRPELMRDNRSRPGKAKKLGLLDYLR